VKCSIKENAFIARLAAWKLNARQVAIVIGHTIYLHNTSKATFLNNLRWLRHELKHVQQFEEHGFLPFIVKYLWESMKSGYTNNRYEVEARAAENDETICRHFTLQGK
jgi:hypothetical protein